MTLPVGFSLPFEPPMILRSTIAAREAFAQSATLEASEKPERLLLPPSVRFWERARMTIASCRVMVAVGLA